MIHKSLLQERPFCHILLLGKTDSRKKMLSGHDKGIIPDFEPGNKVTVCHKVEQGKETLVKMGKEKHKKQGQQCDDCPNDNPSPVLPCGQEEIENHRHEGNPSNAGICHYHSHRHDKE